MRFLLSTWLPALATLGALMARPLVPLAPPLAAQGSARAAAGASPIRFARYAHIANDGTIAFTYAC